MFDDFGTLCIKWLKGEPALWHFSRKMTVQVSQLTELCKGKNIKKSIYLCLYNVLLRQNSLYLEFHFSYQSMVFSNRRKSVKKTKSGLIFHVTCLYHAKSTRNLLRSLRILRSFLKRYDSEWFLASGLGTNGLIFQMNCYF